MAVVRLGLLEVLAPLLELAACPDPVRREPRDGTLHLAAQGASTSRIVDASMAFVNSSRRSARSDVVDAETWTEVPSGARNSFSGEIDGRGGEPALAVGDEPVERELRRAPQERPAEARAARPRRA